jgi:hypothetical protein
MSEIDAVYVAFGRTSINQQHLGLAGRPQSKSDHLPNFR